MPLFLGSLLEGARYQSKKIRQWSRHHVLSAFGQPIRVCKVQEANPVELYRSHFRLEPTFNLQKTFTKILILIRHTRPSASVNPRTRLKRQVTICTPKLKSFHLSVLRPPRAIFAPNGVVPISFESLPKMQESMKSSSLRQTLQQFVCPCGCY